MKYNVVLPKKRIRLLALGIAAATVVAMPAFASSLEEQVADLTKRVEALEELLGVNAADESDVVTEADEPENSEPITESAIDEEGESVAEEDGAVITHEYFFDVAGDTLYYMIIKNNTDKDVEIDTNTVARSADGTMVAAGSSGISTLAPGTESWAYKYFENVTKDMIATCETTISLTDPIYEGMNDDLQAEVSDTGQKLIVSLTNTSDKVCEYVNGIAFFFSGDECIGTDEAFFAGNDTVLAPGATIVQDFDSNSAYDRYELYFYSRGEYNPF